MDNTLIAALRAAGFSIDTASDGFMVTTDLGQWGPYPSQEEALLDGIRRLIRRAQEAEESPDISP
jgi:hypothetical protein